MGEGWLGIDAGFRVALTGYTDHRLENLFDLVGKGMGVALLMKQLALYVDNPEIAVVDVSPGVSTQINLCYLKGAELSDAAKHLVLRIKPQ